MEAAGLILDAVGAVLIALGQWRLSGANDLRLKAVDVNVLGIAHKMRHGGDVTLVAGAEEHLERAVRWNRGLALAGWTLFVIGILFQLVKHLP